MEKFYLTGRIIRRFMGLNTENLKEVNVNLDLVVAKQAEYRSVVDAYDAMIASIASTQFSIDIQAEDDLSSLQTLLSNQQQILNRIVLYIIETIKIANIKKVVESVRRNPIKIASVLTILVAFYAIDLYRFQTACPRGEGILNTSGKISPSLVSRFKFSACCLSYCSTNFRSDLFLL